MLRPSSIPSRRWKLERDAADTATLNIFFPVEKPMFGFLHLVNADFLCQITIEAG